MKAMLEFLEAYGTQISAFGAAVAFIFGAYKFQAERKASHFWREFEAYHKLVKELVEPPAENGALYIDRQTAAMYELRFYKRYFPHSLRMLKSLREKWVSVPNQFPRLIEEIDLTIQYIGKKQVGRVE
ncbi:MAG: hypothetical protein WC799_03955 [Desulfobacteraceae bacterium]|jgi:hypothetical protein